jgi:hypothetical protein
LRKRIPPGQATIKVECFECPASYTAADVGGGKVECNPDQLEIACGNRQCGKKIVVWRGNCRRAWAGRAPAARVETSLLWASGMRETAVPVRTRITSR